MGNYDFTLDLTDQNNTQYLINEQIKDGSRVLEFGPANGRLTKHLKENRNCRLTIVEIDAEAGESAKKFAEESFLGPDDGDIEKFHWTKISGKFDAIIFEDVLEHLHCPDLVLKKCIPLLNEDGRILVSVPNIVHNSVLVEMLNDRFDYTKVGLLDNTHVHFFTYASFRKMVKDCGLFIENVQPVYSRLGNNEIDNSWDEVPSQLERFLRERTQGSIYQYVYSIALKDVTGGELPDLKPLEIEQKRNFDARLYYRKDEESKYSDEQCVISGYSDGGEIVYTRDFGEIGPVWAFQFHPLSENALILFEECKVKNADSELVLPVKSANCSQHFGRIYAFYEQDPWFEFEEIPPEYANGTLEIQFQIVAFRIEKGDEEVLKALFDSLDGDAKGLTLEDLVAGRDALSDAKKYIAHLESDLKELTEGENSLSKQLSEAGEYIGHLEKDHAEVTEYARHLEKDLNEVKESVGALKEENARLKEELSKTLDFKIKKAFKRK